MFCPCVSQGPGAPTIDIETISSELLIVQKEAEAEMRAATTLQVLLRSNINTEYYINTRTTATTALNVCKTIFVRFI